MRKRKKRRTYPLVNRSHQYRFLALILMYAAIIVTVLAFFLFVPDIMQLQDETRSFEVRLAAAEKILNMHVRMWPTVLALVCFIGIHSFRTFLCV